MNGLKKKEPASMRKVKWGLIGCGDIAQKRVAPALRDLDNCELVAVNRAQFRLAEAFARRFGVGKWYADWQELIVDPEIEAVYVATPVYLHAEQTIAAAEAGKHVLCEKPMGLTVSECDRMIAACQANAVKLAIAYYRHFYPIIERCKEIITAGEIGQMILVQVNAFEYFDLPIDHPRYWFLRKDLAGGGPMFDFGCHRIEVLLNLFGPIKRTLGVTCNVLFEREVEDTATALFQFQRGGRGILTVSHAAFEFQDTLDIFGSLGSLHIPVLNQSSLIVKTANGERQEEHPGHTNLHAPLIEDFAQAILQDREPKVSGHLGREVAKIEEEIYRTL